MTHQEKTPKEMLQEAVAELRAEKPQPEVIEAASDRVWQRLSQSQAVAAEGEVVAIAGCGDVRRLLPKYRAAQLSPARALLLEAHLHECVDCRREAQSAQPATSAFKPWRQELPRISSQRFRWAMAAAAVIVLGVGIYLIQDRLATPSGMRARVESFSGALYRVGFSGDQPLKAGDELQEGESVRAASGSRALLRLRDGSQVELNERAQLAVSMHRDDTTVKLDRGNIIIQAAKRQSGHLYVAAKDCRVAVTGTVFSVHSGLKGSRVSVIAGEVRVMEAGAVKILHPGDQLSTSASVGAVPVPKEIAWSQNVDQHLALLAEFGHFANKLDTIQMPGLRYQSSLLPLLPPNTVLYAAIPNLGDAARQADQLFEQELQESPVLRQWWQQVQTHKHGPDLKEILSEVHALGAYLGNEIVFSVSLGENRGYPLVVAQIQKPGLKDFIAQEYAGRQNFVVVDEQELRALPAQTSQKHLVILVRPDFVAASDDAAALQQFVADLNQGGGGFASTPFGERMSSAYQNGAALLFGANLGAMTAHHQRTVKQQEVFAGTGLADVQYLVAERKEIAGQTQNRADLTFNGPRHGMASWLAAPAPIGGLDYVSPDAAAVGAFVTKSPAKMLDDVLAVAYTSNGNAQAEVAKGEAELQIKFHQDLVDTLGGEVTFALDGPILPTPSWKIIAEVYDPGRLQTTIRQLVSDVNQHLKTGKYGLALDQEQVSGLTYYTLRSLDPTKPVEINYTFSDGFIILGPSRALVMQALDIHKSGNSLARSAAFRAMLPQDEHADVSALVYQNLAPVVGPVMQRLTPQQLQSLQQLAAETKPSVVCAYGEDNAIRVASNSRFFGLDLNTLALSTLLKLAAGPGVK
ncbi:MAG TPA: FecR domain-containing protein [Candidatus Angelobacter sp.]|nr:FecR domain-containing protein [Candidatus Angelobacter sp.]